MNTYSFSENNSGGSWWLDKRQYEKLFAAGWKYKPDKYDIEKGNDKPSKNSLSGPDVPYGWRHGITFKAKTIKEAVDSFEEATGADFFAEGCNCCGCPFSIHKEGNGEYESISGDSVAREAIRPW